LTLGQEQKLRLSEQEDATSKSGVKVDQIKCRLLSNKMAALKELLTTTRTKLNASAIQLQITAQSSLGVSDRGQRQRTTAVVTSSDFYDVTSSTEVAAGNQRPKRQRMC
jgi:hypothetical protein